MKISERRMAVLREHIRAESEHDMEALLAGMTPTLRPETYVFRTLPPGQSLRPGIAPFATVREDEGLTVVVEQEAAGESGDEGFRAITLGVHSSLNAVGFIAVVARALADAGISANVIAGIARIVAARAAAMRFFFMARTPTGRELSASSTERRPLTTYLGMRESCGDRS